MFDDYVELSDRTIRNEWVKVQERFQSVQFSESAATTIRMVAKAIRHTKPLPNAVDAKISEELSALKGKKSSFTVGVGF